MSDIIELWQNTESIWLIFWLLIWYISGAGMFLLAIYQINKNMTYGELIMGLIIGGLSGFISFFICGMIFLIEFFEQNKEWWNKEIQKKTQ